MRRSTALWMTLTLAVLAASPALATNGMYLTAYGSEAAGRAGANIAVADRALAIQSNPAGMAQLVGNHFSLDVQVLMPDLDYSDPNGNMIEGESNQFFMPSFSYVRGGKKWSWGIGLVSQGGMGAHFKGYNTPFGTQDETYSQVRFMTLIPAFSYAFTDDVSIGVSANIGWSDVAFRFYPETSFYNDNGTPTDPSDDMGFFGMNLDEPASTFNYSFRVGLMWRAHPVVQIGLVYQTETQSDYDGGKLILNQTSLGLGKVSYDAAVEGFTWPEQYGLGFQFRPAENWILALDVKQYNWSKAIETITVRGTNPDAMTPLTEPEIPFVFNWEDQTVVALGAEWRVNDGITLRGGYNQGDSPVPDETLNPLFPAIVEKHAAFGLGWNVKSYTINFALERGFENTQTNPNPDPNVNPFGPGATVAHSQWTFSAGFSKAFSR